MIKVHVVDWTLKLFQVPLQQEILIIEVTHVALKYFAFCIMLPLRRCRDMLESVTSSVRASVHFLLQYLKLPLEKKSPSFIAKIHLVGSNKAGERRDSNKSSALHSSRSRDQCVSTNIPGINGGSGGELRRRRRLATARGEDSRLRRGGEPGREGKGGGSGSGGSDKAIKRSSSLMDF